MTPSQLVFNYIMSIFFTILIIFIALITKSSNKRFENIHLVYIFYLLLNIIVIGMNASDKEDPEVVTKYSLSVAVLNSLALIYILLFVTGFRTDFVGVLITSVPVISILGSIIANSIELK